MNGSFTLFGLCSAYMVALLIVKGAQLKERAAKTIVVLLPWLCLALIRQRLL